MKNPLLMHLSCVRKPKKAFRIMEISFFILFVCVCQLFALEGDAQNATIKLSSKTLSVAELFVEIEEQTDYLVVYSSSEVDTSHKLSFKKTTTKVSDCLDEVLNTTNLKYEFTNNYIILSNNTKPQVIQQQKKRITGTVTDPKGEAIIGANVVEKGTANGTITDLDGKFALDVAEKGSLQITYIGYNNQELAFEGKSIFAIQLMEDTEILDEVIVVGYGTAKKRDLTGAVSVVKVSEIDNQVSSNVMQSLQGRVPGVFITSNGSPDGAATVMIRGVSTLGENARSGPLYIIDGMPSTSGMNELASQDIESIQVLKDASSASIYGSRAANGVIIITTKKADRQKTSVSLRASLSVKNYSKSLDWLNAEERGRIQWQSYRNDNNDPNFGTYSFKDHQDNNGNWILDEVIMPEYLDAAKTMRSADTDWAKEVGRTAVTQNYNMTVSTGGPKGRSLITLDYLNNQGTVKETYNERISARVNSDYSMLDGRLLVAENMSIAKTRKSRLDAGAILNNTREIQPIVPIHTVDGVGWGGPVGGMSDRMNPLRRIEQSKENADNRLRMFGDISIDLEIIKNLRIKTMLGMDYTFSWFRNMFLPYKEGYMSDPTAVVTNREERFGNWVWTNTLNYNFDMAKEHHFTLLAGQEMMRYNYNFVEAERKNYASLDPDYMYLDVGETNQANAGNATEYALLSYFGKINYNYANRYLVSLTIRHDGSSRFGANNRFSTFPAFSLGWRVSEEAFFKNALPFISDLKFRYGWGQTGNQDINNFASLGLYEARYSSSWINNTDYYTGTAYDLQGSDSGTLLSGYRRTQQANPNLRWETATQNNFGVDFALLENKLSGSFDYFIKNTEDILVTPPYIGALGEGGDMNINGASMRNKGFEFMLTYNEKWEDFLFSVSGNIAAYSNKITKLPPEVWDAYPGNGVDQIILGHARDSYYGHIAEGLFQSKEEVDTHAEQIGKGIGRIKFKDLNNDGQITEADRTWIGVQDPDFVYGLNFNLAYKQWDLSMFWNGVCGGVVDTRWTKSYMDFYGVGFSGENYGKRTLDAWTPLNTNSDIPMLSATDANNEARISTYYMESMSYLKLRNIELGYTLSEHVRKILHMQSARVYILGENLFKIKKSWGDNPFTGADPETPNTAYPIPFSFTLGINVSF